MYEYKEATIVPIYNAEDLFGKEILIDNLPIDDMINYKSYMIGEGVAHAILNAKLPHKNRVKGLIKIFDYIAKLYNYDTKDISYRELIGVFSNPYIKYKNLLVEKTMILKPMINPRTGLLFNHNNYPEAELWDENDPKFESHCTKYEIDKEVLTERLCVVILPIKNICNYNYKEDGRLKKYLLNKKRLRNTVRDAVLNHRAAIVDEYIYYVNKSRSIPSFAKRIQNVLSFDSRKYLVEGKKVKRLYTQLGALSSVSRGHLTYKKKVFHTIDVSMCQPLLLIYYLRKNDYPIDQEYIDDVFSGEFYERFITDQPMDFKKPLYIPVTDDDETEGDGDGKKRKYKTIWKEYTLIMNKENAKTELFSSVFFDIKYYNEIYKRFKYLYKKTAKSLNIINKLNDSDVNDDPNACRLPSELQNLEAAIFRGVFDVAKKSKGIFLIHDAVCFDSEYDKMDIINYLHEKFSDLNLDVRLTYDDKKVDRDGNVIEKEDITTPDNLMFFE